MSAFATVLAMVKRISPPWPSTDDDTDVGKELGTIATVLAVAKDLVDALIDELLPDTTTFLIERWEKITRVATIPSDPIATRRARVLAVLRRINGPRISQLEQMLAPILDLAVSDMVWVEQLRSDIEERMTQTTGVVALAVPAAVPGRIIIFEQNRPGVVDDTGVLIYIALSSVGATVATLSGPDGTSWAIPVNATVGWYFTRSVFTGKAAAGRWYLQILDSSASTLTEARLLVSNNVDSGAIYNFFVLRDPALPGSPDLIQAQRLFHRTALGHMNAHVIETQLALCDDAHSLADRDPLGV